MKIEAILCDSESVVVACTPNKSVKCVVVSSSQQVSVEERGKVSVV